MPQFDSFDDLTDTAEDRALPIKLDGLTLPWLVDGLAIRRASDRDVEIGSVLATLQRIAPDEGDEAAEGNEAADIDEEDLESVPRAITAFADLLWIGFLRFAPELDRDRIHGRIDIGTIEELPAQQMIERLGASADPDAPEPAAGKA